MCIVLHALRPGQFLIELPVILEYEVSDSNLDLIGREEAAGARMHAMSEAKHLGAGRDELPPVFLAGLLTQRQEATSVEAVGVFAENGRIDHGDARDSNHGALGQVSPIFENNVFGKNAIDEGCGRVSK